MKKVFATFCMAAVLTGLSSCASSKGAFEAANLHGEWNIIEINGTAVVPAPGEEFPFIGFNARTNELHGFTGCNRLLGTFQLNGKGGIDLSGMGSTKMMCADMKTEDNLFAAMARVKTVKKLGADNVALCGSSDKPLVVLQKR